jgi:hypothetical protein
MPNCDCGTCCNDCGHDTNCTSQTAETADPSSEYRY